MNKKFELTIGICAYNEERNIGALLTALQTQVLEHCVIKEIIVVSSGSTDNTDSIVERYAEKDSRVRLVKQMSREGKASAVNLILKNANGDVVVLASADILPLEDTIEKLVLPFLDETIGMTGGHPIPKNCKDNFMGFAVHFIWEMHHKLSLKNPKFGELIAFRNIIREIPVNTSVDEAAIESNIKDNGLRMCYSPDAIVYNKGASTVKEFLCQRRHYNTGHIHLKKQTGYTVSSMSIGNLARPIIDTFSFKPKEMFWTFGVIFLELYGRLLGVYDFYIAKKNPYIWQMAKTTKGPQVSAKVVQLATDISPQKRLRHQKLKCLINVAKETYLRQRIEAHSGSIPAMQSDLDKKIFKI